MTFILTGPDGRQYPSAVPGALGGHRRGRIYGRLDCPSALRALAAGGYLRDRVFFADPATAVAAGYRPCAVCLPVEYALWKTSSAKFHVERRRVATFSGTPECRVRVSPLPSRCVRTAVEALSRMTATREPRGLTTRHIPLSNEVPTYWRSKESGANVPYTLPEPRAGLSQGGGSDV